MRCPVGPGELVQRRLVRCFFLDFGKKVKKVMKSSLWHEAFDKAFDIIYCSTDQFL